MSLRAKLFLLLGTIIVLFVAGLLLLQHTRQRHFEALAEARWRERSEAFDRFLEHWTEPLQTFVADNSAWNDLVEALEGRGSGASPQVLGENALTSYHAHVVWVYRADGSLLGTQNVLYSPAVAELPVPVAPLLERLGRDKFCHFFAKTSLGLLEIRGATVHPWQDTARHTPARGYLLAGRLWSGEDLKEMALFTGDSITIEKCRRKIVAGEQTAGSPEAAAEAEETPGSITLRRDLPGADGQPVAQVVVHNDSPIVREFAQLSRTIFLCLIGFALLIYVLLILALRRWVLRPLRTISRALQTEDPALLEGWARQRDDYGHLARVIRTFFAQRHELVTEMQERRRAEAALREREEELRHALKLEAIGRLAGGVAHDFNNLLTIIIGYASMLPEPAHGGSERAGRLILSAAEKAAGLTRQLLAFSRKQVLRPRVLDLNALVHEMERLLRRTLGAQVELRVACGARTGRIRADPTQLEQVIVNLAINARDAMERGGVLTMATEEAASPEGAALVALVVRDTGCGMDRATQERIFEPFFTTKGPGRGTGLGLATVYGIVRQSGGSIAVESEVGRGTSFRVEFPAASAPVDPPQAALPPLPKSAEPKSVLVLDDDTAVRDLICRVLQNHHMSAECVATGAEALGLAAAAREPYDLLIADVVMPGMSGPELAVELRRRWPRLPVLLISGYAPDAPDEPCSLRCPCLDKPFTPQTLMREVFALLAAEPAVSRATAGEAALARE